MIGSVLNWISSFFGRLTNAVLNYLSALFGFLFSKLFEFLKLIFKPFFILIAIIFYVLYKVGELALVLLQLLLGIAQVFVSLVKGIFLTLSGFTFTPSSRSDGSWTPIFENVVGGLESYQFSTISYILIFLIWFSFGFAAIRILSSMRGGA